MDCPVCETVVLEVLIDDSCACDVCGHRWMPEDDVVEDIAAEPAPRAPRPQAA